MCTGCFEKSNVTQGMVYQTQLVRCTENNLGFTTKLVHSIVIKCIIFIGTSEKPKNLIIYKYVGTPCTFQQIALKEIENYI